MTTVPLCPLLEVFDLCRDTSDEYGGMWTVTGYNALSFRVKGSVIRGL